jgi:hypothetical protein
MRRGTYESESNVIVCDEGVVGYRTGAACQGKSELSEESGGNSATDSQWVYRGPAELEAGAFWLLEYGILRM